jgi:hypothetical protein
MEGSKSDPPINIDLNKYKKSKEDKYTVPRPSEEENERQDMKEKDMM